MSFPSAVSCRNVSAPALDALLVPPVCRAPAQRVVAGAGTRSQAETGLPPAARSLQPASRSLAGLVPARLPRPRTVVRRRRGRRRAAQEPLAAQGVVDSAVVWVRDPHRRTRGAGAARTPPADAPPQGRALPGMRLRPPRHARPLPGVRHGCPRFCAAYVGGPPLMETKKGIRL